MNLRGWLRATWGRGEERREWGGARRHGLPRMRVSSLRQLLSIPMEIAQEKKKHVRVGYIKDPSCPTFPATRSPGFVP